MELRHLRYFVEVAEALNYRKAAARVHISAPALHVQIKELEQDIGARLLVREGNAIKLTKAGATFLPEARETLERVRQGVARAQALGRGESGHLAIGHNAVAEVTVLPGIVAAFAKVWPNVHLSFHSYRTPQQVEHLAQGGLGVGFVCPPIAAEGLDLHELTRQPFVAVVPQGHRLAPLAEVSFRDLCGEPLVVGARSLDPDAFHQFEQHFARAGAQMNVVAELETTGSIVSFVASGHGCSILPEYVRRLCPPEVVCKSLNPAGTLHRTLAIVKKRYRGGLAEAFYRFVIDMPRQSAAAA